MPDRRLLDLRELDFFAADLFEPDLLDVDVFAVDRLEPDRFADDLVAVDRLEVAFFAVDLFAPALLGRDVFAADALVLDFRVLGFLAPDFLELEGLRPAARAAFSLTASAASSAFWTAISSILSATAPMTPWVTSDASTFFPV